LIIVRRVVIGGGVVVGCVIVVGIYGGIVATIIV